MICIKYPNENQVVLGKNVGVKKFTITFHYFSTFLAHLNRRLIGELIVYKGIRRPSVRRPSVNIFKQHFL